MMVWAGLLILALCSDSAGTVAVVKQVMGYRCNKKDYVSGMIQGQCSYLLSALHCKTSLWNLKIQSKEGKHIIIMLKIKPFKLVF